MNLKTAFLLIWITFLLFSCGRGQYQTTRSHYTPNLAKEKLNTELAFVAGVGVSANVALKISKNWGAVANFQSNQTSYEGESTWLNSKRIIKTGYSYDLGANYNTQINERVSFNISGGGGYNNSTYYSKFKGNSFDADQTSTQGYYYYVQPYLRFSKNKFSHLLAIRVQNYSHNTQQKVISNNQITPEIKTTEQHSPAFSLSYGIDWNVMSNLNLTSQIGLETNNSSWAKIGIQFVLPSKK